MKLGILRGRLPAGCVLALGLCALGAGGALSGCEPDDIPATPTYAEDVRPILLANCVRCHEPTDAADGGADAATGGSLLPKGFRLDRWESTGECPPPDGSVGTTCVLGVRDMAERVVARAADEGSMPPAQPLTDRQREILKRWERAGWP